VLSNWQNAISDVASVTVTKQWKAIPTVNIETYSSDTLFQVNRSITLSGSASGSTCNKAPPNFLFEWTTLDDSKSKWNLMLQCNSMPSLSASRHILFLQGELTLLS